MKYQKIYLLHGLGGSPNGSVHLLQLSLEKIFSQSKFIRPLLPHNNYNLENPEQTVEFLEDLNIPEGSLVIGISLGGLVAAKLQEESRPDLTVICLISPTSFKSIKLEKKMPNRVVFYSSKDKVVGDRVANWSKLAEAYDLQWPEHDIDPHIPEIVELIKGYVKEK